MEYAFTVIFLFLFYGRLIIEDLFFLILNDATSQ